MRPSTRASLILLAFFAAQAQAAPNVAQRQVAVQCPPSDKGGVALTSSEGADAGSPGLVTCTYGTTATGGAGPCTFFPANGSFSSGSSQCPAGIAQDPSAT
ncbi:hypothetical protein FB45DRAFT_870445 [Roridomyces roridus]|uniref:Uncharacterized protein n=1 Tax=Roridomyces roridus TaxID=1738132 RepID=A0AAD7BIH2_9AGAR|nr:hypothetical protein FB45DRAFT_870445 [Roridomyces roridus]